MTDMVRTGYVSCAPFPRRAFEDQLDARYRAWLKARDQADPDGLKLDAQLAGEMHGLCVGLSIISSKTIEQVRDEMVARCTTT